MDGEFDRATAVRDAGGGTYAADVPASWDIRGNANGGLLLAMCARAMASSLGRPPLTVTGHYLAPVPAGPCTIDVDVVREGRRMATAAATMHRDGRPLLRTLGTFAHQSEEGPRWIDGAPPELPLYDECVAHVAVGEFAPAMVDRLAVRLRPGDEAFREGISNGRPEIAGWFAFADGQPIDAISLMFVADAFPPPVFNMPFADGRVPTIELTVHVRGVPAPGPLRCIYRSRFVQGGLHEEDGEIWDSGGALVAQSRQISLTST
jgi:hypothetical protein